MKQTKTIPIILTAAKGKYLTQAADVTIIHRVISTSITLAANDAPENWREITDAEAAAIRTEKQRISDERMKQHTNPTTL